MMRLDRFLSVSTSYSRSDIKKMAKQKRISVNGTAAANSDMKVDVNDDIRIDDIRVIFREFIYLMLNKPAGYLSATEDDHDPVVIDFVPENLKHYAPFPVGRLDKDSEGLLLLTNDGQFDHRLMAPSKNLYKRYFVKLDAPAVPEDIAIFASGMEFKEFTAKPARLELTQNPCEAYVEIAEGKFHQVKRMCERVGKNVLYLKRVAIGNLQLDESLAPGQCRELTEDDFIALGLK